MKLFDPSFPRKKAGHASDFSFGSPAVFNVQDPQLSAPSCEGIGFIGDHLNLIINVKDRQFHVHATFQFIAFMGCAERREGVN